MLDIHSREMQQPFSRNEARALIAYALFYLKLIPASYADKSTREADDDLNSYQLRILLLLPAKKIGRVNYDYLELFAKAHHIKTAEQARILLNQIAEKLELDPTLLSYAHPAPSLASICALYHRDTIERTDLHINQAELLKSSLSELTYKNDTPNDFYVIQGDPSILEIAPWISPNVAAAFLIEAIDLMEIKDFLPHLKLLASLCKHQPLEERLENLGVCFEQLPEPFLSKFKQYQQFTSNTELEPTEASEMTFN